jgi:hypothetical protein
MTSGLTIPPAGALNTVAAPRGLAAAGARSLVPLTYGVDRQPALILNVLPAAGDANTLLVVCLWGHALHQVDELRLNDGAMPAGATVTSYTGSQTTPDATLVAAFAAQGITYTDTLAGYAFSVVAMPTRSFDGQLNFSARLYGRKVYDPRKDSTAGGSGSHLLADPTTWEWSDNPSLALADWHASTLYGAGEPVLWSSVPAAANANDALVGSPAEKRRVLGVTLLRDGVNVQAVAETLRAYAGCWLVPTGAGVRLLPDADAAPVASYAHAMGQIAALDSLRLRDLGNVPTAVEITYTDTSQVPWRTASATASMPGAGTTLPWRLSTVALPGVQRYSQAYREAVERLNKLNLGDLSFPLQVFDAGIGHEVGDIITVTHPIGLSAKPMRVTDVEMPAHGRWVLAVTEHDPVAYSEEVQTAPSIPDTTRVAGGGPVANVAGFAGTVSKGRISWVWTPATDPGYAATELRPTDADWNVVSPVPPFRGAANGFQQVVSATGTYTLWARHYDVLGNASASAVQASVVVLDADLVQDGVDGDDGPQGPAGVNGVAGTSVAEINAYIRSTSEPPDPTGGSFNFASQVLTPPAGWSVGVPDGTDPVYVARGLASTGTPGSTVTPVWGSSALAFSDGQAVDVVFLRSAGTPATPAPSAGVPAGWYSAVDSVPAGTDPLWSSFGERSSPAGNWVWQGAVRVQGVDGEDGPQGPQGVSGVNGAAGSSVAELNAYIRSSSEPPTPSGGAFDFSSQILTPPPGWSVGVPDGTDPVYVSRGLAFTATPGASVGLSWGSVALAFADGQAVDVVFIRAASQPSTPAPSAGVPAGWYSTVASVPPGADPLWSSFGERAAVGLNWTWQAAVQVQGVDGADGPEGPAAVSAGTDQAAVVLTADSTGLVDSSALPVTITAYAKLGGAVDTSNWTWSRTSTSGITTSIGGASVTITAVDTALESGIVTITGTRSGYADIGIVIPVTKSKRATPAAGPVAAPGNFFVFAFGLSPTNAVSTFQFRRDGTLWRTVNGSSAKVGDWYLPNGSTVGDAYDVRADLISSSGLSGGLSGEAVSSWLQINATRSFTLTTTEDSYSERLRVFSYTIRLRSTEAVVSSGQFTLETVVEL